MKLNSVFLYLLLSLSILILFTNTAVYAQNQEQSSSDRWFEIEVILFKQLGNKNELKEQFPSGINASILPPYKQFYDLLGPYIQPNLTAIKQHLPRCSKAHNNNENNKYNANIDVFQNIGIANIKPAMEVVSTTFINTIKETPHPSDELSSGLAPTLITEPTITENTASLTPILNFQVYEKILNNPIFATNNLCIITQQDMNNILSKEQLSNFNIHSFGVEALPSRLNAPGIHNNENPYLISDESLLLKDISQNLRWSREFQPLFHFGWRQVGITENKAIPMKLFAGEHIEYQYKKALDQYQAEVSTAIEIENNLLAQIPPYNQFEDKVEINFAQKQQALSQLFAQLTALQRNTTNKAIDTNEIDNNTISDIVDEVSKQNLNSFLAQHNTDKNQSDERMKPNDIAPPLQPWFLDGFIKIHLDHYLYITADFNVFNQTPDIKKNTNTTDNTYENTNELKLINFSQNRRVITGEIHYFDHPYVGMIVQIRRFDPSKPEGERVSQAIK